MSCTLTRHEAMEKEALAAESESQVDYEAGFVLWGGGLGGRGEQKRSLFLLPKTR